MAGRSSSSASNAESLARYVAGNPDAVVAYVQSFPQDQRTARFAAIYRAVRKERDAEAARAAEAVLAAPMLQNIKSGRDVRLYRSFAQQAFEAALPGVELDTAWAAAKEAENSRDLEKLQVALGQAQGALAKEGIRVAEMNIAEHYFLTGDTANAMKHAARAFESSDRPETYVAATTLSFRVAVFAESGPNLPMAAAHVQYMQRLARSTVEVARSRVCAALVALDGRSYRTAANHIAALRTDTGAAAATTLDFNAVLEPIMHVGDFAMIAAVLVLSQFDRAQLERFLGNPDFKVLFETETELRQALTHFLECKYFDSLSTLGAVLQKMRMDLFLQPHAAALMQTIRARAVRQYVAPFVAVDLAKMAAVFHTTVPELEAELAGMIRRGDIDARIDKARLALVATRSDSEQQAALRAATLATDFVEDAEMAIRALSMHRNGVFVAAAPPTLTERQGHSGSYGGHPGGHGGHGHHGGAAAAAGAFGGSMAATAL